MVESSTQNDAEVGFMQCAWLVSSPTNFKSQWGKLKQLHFLRNMGQFIETSMDVSRDTAPFGMPVLSNLYTTPKWILDISFGFSFWDVEFDTFFPRFWTKTPMGIFKESYTLKPWDVTWTSPQELPNSMKFATKFASSTGAVAQEKPNRASLPRWFHHHLF